MHRPPALRIAIVVPFAGAMGCAILAGLSEYGDGAPPAGDASLDASQETSTPDAVADARDGFSSDGGAPDADAGCPDKIIFVTSTAHAGAFGGSGYADFECQRLATAASMNGSYKAWISVADASASDHVAHGCGLYVLPTGIVVAQSWSALTSGRPLDHPIDSTERGAAPRASTHCGAAGWAVWTGTSDDGQGTGVTCADWSLVVDAGGTVGCTEPVDGGWSDTFMELPCVESLPFYCFEQ